MDFIGGGELVRFRLYEGVYFYKMVTHPMKYVSIDIHH